MEKKSDLVSIVVASYNQPHYLPLTLNSLLTQLYPNMEIIVVTVDTDEPTNKILETLCPLNPSLRHLKVSTPDYLNQRNVGIKTAQGKYISLFDSDDVAFPTKISQEYTLAEKKNAVLVYSTYINADEQLNMEISGRAAGRLLIDCPNFPDPSYEYLTRNNYIYDYALVRREIYDEFGVFDHQWKEAAMYGKWLQIAEKYIDRIFYNPHPTFIYRHPTDQISLEQMQKAEHKAIVNKMVIESIQRRMILMKAKEPQWEKL